MSINKNILLKKFFYYCTASMSKSEIKNSEVSSFRVGTTLKIHNFLNLGTRVKSALFKKLYAKIRRCHTFNFLLFCIFHCQSKKFLIWKTSCDPKKLISFFMWMCQYYLLTVFSSNPQLINQMNNLIFYVWNEIAESAIRNLIDSMPNRLQEVLKKSKSEWILIIFE